MNLQMEEMLRKGVWEAVWSSHILCRPATLLGNSPDLTYWDFHGGFITQA